MFCFLKKISILPIAKVLFAMWIGCTMTQIKKSQDKILSLEAKILDHINGAMETQDFYLPSDNRNETNSYACYHQSETPLKSDLSFKFDDQSLKAAVDLWFKNSTECEEKYGSMGVWDTSEVTNMQQLFKNRRLFNEDISKWDVSKVTDMSGMFDGASSFNHSLSSWNVSKVTDMSRMFDGASSFNQT